MNKDTQFLAEAYEKVLEAGMGYTNPTQPASVSSYKVGDTIILNHPNYPGMTNKKFSVQQVQGDKVDLVGIDNQGYSEPRSGVFWVDTKYVTKAQK
jgi:hypothetical protein